MGKLDIDRLCDYRLFEFDVKRWGMNEIYIKLII